MMISREIEVSQFVQIPLMIETLFGYESFRDTGKEGWLQVEKINIKVNSKIIESYFSRLVLSRKCKVV